VVEGAVPSKEETVSVKHKTSGKELRVTKQSVEKYKAMGYHPMKEEVEQIEERSLSTGEKTAMEKNVKGMKKNIAGFKERYGKDAKSVMYATATKQAKGE
jgi:hypothetical protein